MTDQIELTCIDLRYEMYRMKSKVVEMKLLESILTQGIREPLQGVETKEGRILLNGFKRYRCAVKLGLGTVPWCCIGTEAPLGIISLLRFSTEKTLTIVEQAKLINELQTIHQLSQSDIALHLEKSRAWVNVRASLFKEMPDDVAETIFKGHFPAYSYMYSLRKFMRINTVTNKQVSEFVRLVAGQTLSIREIDLLADGYFNGSDLLREQLREGRLSFTLSQMKSAVPPTSGSTCPEQEIIQTLEQTRRQMKKIIRQGQHAVQTAAAKAQANLLAADIIHHLTPFETAVRGLHDHTRHA